MLKKWFFLPFSPLDGMNNQRTTSFFYRPHGGNKGRGPPGVLQTEIGQCFHICGKTDGDGTFFHVVVFVALPKILKSVQGQSPGIKICH